MVARGSEILCASPRQSGLAWTACEERTSVVAAGDRMRLRTVAQIRTPAGNLRRLANGTAVIVQSVDSSGCLVLCNGSTLLSRQVVHGYALTSHAAQGLTVDRVFMAGAISREGLYVSATRGREGIRIFVPDRTAFLDAVGLRAESRISAMEFARKHTIQTGLRATLVRGWRHWQHMCALSPPRVTAMPAGDTQVRPPSAIVTPPKPSARIVDTDNSPRPEPPRERMRIRL